ncbi:MAG: AAA family ATPase [Gemmatimonadales bacterium]|nr:AAA family ATPase [Gemmatimonadales bacterium]
MPDALRLVCLGSPALVRADGTVFRLKTRKHLALLVYLAIEDRAHRREHLCDLLWPLEPNRSDARHSLSTALSALRRTLGADALDTTNETVRLRAGRLPVDVARLEAGRVLADGDVAALDVGPFLDDFELPDAEHFTAWREAQHARLLPRVRDALLQLIGHARTGGEFARVEGLADRLLALDEYAEEAIRAKMEARCFRGDRLGALRAFEAWRGLVVRELGAVPSPELDALAGRLRQRGVPAAADPSETVPRREPWQEQPFVGRVDEYRRLHDAWVRARGGRRTLVLLIGDTGAGKSTLIGRLAMAAGLEGAATSRVPCVESDRAVPFAAFIRLLEPLVGQPGAVAASPESLARLARFAPSIRRRFPSLPTITDEDGESARLHLADAAHEVLTVIGEEQPLLLVVDDVHFADEASLALFHLLLRRTPQPPLLFAMVTRAEALARGGEAGRLLDWAEREGLEHLALGPLGREESEAVVRGLLEAAGHPAPTVAERRALVEAAAGSPMALELLVRDWAQAGEATVALAVSAMSEGGPAREQARSVIRRLVERALAGLDATSRAVLDVAAVLGRRLDDLELYEVAEFTIGQVAGALGTLGSRALLRDTGSGLEFTNELVRAEVYALSPLAVRRMLHARVADRLEARAAAGAKGLGLELAWHSFRAGRRERAVHWLFTGADEGIHAGAIHAVERALTTAMGELTEEERARANVVVAEVLEAQSRWAESRTHALAAMGAKDREVRELAQISAETAQGYMTLSTIAEGTRSANALIALAKQSPSAKVRVRALRAATAQERRHPLGSWLEEIYDLALRENEHALPIRERLILALARARSAIALGFREECTRTLANALVQAETQRLRSPEYSAVLAAFGAMAAYNGDYATSLDLATRHAAELEERSHTYAAALLCDFAALSCARYGRPTEQEAWARRAIKLSDSATAEHSRHTARSWLIRALAKQGRVREMLEEIDKGDAHYLDCASSYVRWDWRYQSADALVLAGRRGSAHGRISDVLQTGPGVRIALDQRGPYLRWLAVAGPALFGREVALETALRLAESFESAGVLHCAEHLVALEMLGAEADIPQRLRERGQESLRAVPLNSLFELRELGVANAPSLDEALRMRAPT